MNQLPGVESTNDHTHIIEERIKAVKRLQQYHSKYRLSHETFEANGNSHAAGYSKNCFQWGVPDDDEVIFFRYSLCQGSDALHYYYSIVIKARDAGAPLEWKQLCEQFFANYSCMTKQT